MLKALLLSLTVIFTVSCTAASDLTSGDQESAESSAPQDEQTESASPSPTPTADPPPKPKTCRLLKPRDLDTIVNDTEPVTCAKRHTSVTYAVNKLPPKVVRAANAPSDDKVEDAAARTCDESFNDYIGGKPSQRKLSKLSTTYFLPDPEQFELGANWVRCDVFAYAAEGQMANLKGNLEGALDNEQQRANLGICSQVPPEHPRFAHIICQRDHNWRAIGRTALGAQDANFPGPQALSDRATSQCEGKIRQYLGTEDAFSYGFEVPTRESWKQGNRHGLCWAETSD